MRVYSEEEIRVIALADSKLALTMMDNDIASWMAKAANRPMPSTYWDHRLICLWAAKIFLPLPEGVTRPLNSTPPER
jgi:hypothetical protein